MQLVHSDAVFRVEPGSTPDYDNDNPLLKLMTLVERAPLAAERECYDGLSLQYLFPLTWLELYGPTPPNTDQLDPAQQDAKTDFQKQNVRNFHLADTQAQRGWATVDGWRGPVLQLSYRGGPDSALSRAARHKLGATLALKLRLGDGPQATLQVPYDEASGRYLVELWGHPGQGLRERLDVRGRGALDAGVLQPRPDLVQGGAEDFDRLKLEDQAVFDVSPAHSLHPVRPLYLDVTWAAGDSGATDPADGSAYRLGFEMLVRGWDNFLGVGTSPNPHGGVGYLEYRNLFSNYGRYAGSDELARHLEPWNLDAFGRKGHPSGDREPFFAVEYMDLHVLEPACGIGLHRHRDNQEVFLMLDGEGIMVVGDWAASGTRARSFEVRTLSPGHLAMLKGGNLHALINPGDGQASLFMFGGYD